MPAASKAQQRFMGIVHAIQKGDAKASDYSKEIRAAVKSMKKKDVKDYAGTDRKGLPDKVKKEATDRDYKDEYKKFQSSTKSKKYRAELNKYNRQKGTYGNNDGKDASHKGGKIVGFESQSKNRGRAEKSRLKKEAISKDEWAQYPKYARKLKPYMKKLLKVPVRVRVIKQANHNPWIEVRVARFGKDIIPNDFRKKALKVTGGGRPRDMDNITYGNITAGSISMKHDQWVKLLGNKVKSESINEVSFSRVPTKQLVKKYKQMADERLSGSAALTFRLMAKELIKRKAKLEGGKDCCDNCKEGKECCSEESVNEANVWVNPGIEKRLKTKGFDIPKYPKTGLVTWNGKQIGSIDNFNGLTIYSKSALKAIKKAVPNIGIWNPTKDMSMEGGGMSKVNLVNETWSTGLERYKVTLENGEAIDVKVKEGKGLEGLEELLEKEGLKFDKITKKASRPTLTAESVNEECCGNCKEGKVCCDVHEKISKEEWAEYPKYARKLKPYMKRLLKIPVKVRVIKQANHNPWIDVRVARFGKDVIPNDFRKRALKVTGGGRPRDMDNITYGNITAGSVSMKHDQWVKLLGTKVR